MEDEAPTITVKAGPTGDVTTERHPAFGMIGASRVSSGNGAYLHGSDFKHGHFVMVTIHNSSLQRDLSHDWIHSDGHEYIRVSLSEAQWATFVSAMNVGDGVPCTIEHLDGKAVPGIDRRTDRREQFRGELQQTVADAINALKQLNVKIDGLKLAQKAREELTDLVAKAIQELQANVPYVAQSFDEHAERTVERAKIEVNAYLQHAIVRAGIAALGDQAAALPLQLEPGKPEA